MRRVLCLVGTLALAFICSAAPGGTSAQDGATPVAEAKVEIDEPGQTGPGEPALAFLGDEAIAIRLDPGQKTPKKSTDIAVRNLTGASVTATFCFVSDAPNSRCGASGVTIEVADASVDPYQVETLPLAISSDRADVKDGISGYLVMSSGDGTPATSVPLTVTWAKASGLRQLLDWIPVIDDIVIKLVVITFVLALAIVWYVLVRQVTPANWNMPEVEGDALSGDKGWATTITTLVALVTAFSGAELVSGDAVVVPDTTVAALSLLFLVMIGIAPFVYGWIHRTETVGGHEFVVGTKQLLFVSCVMTLWAVLGQSTLVAVFLEEVHQRGALPDWVFWFLWVAVLVVGFLILLYASRAMRTMVETQKKAPGTPPPIVIELSQDTMGLTGDGTSAGRVEIPNVTPTGPKAPKFSGF